MPSRYLVMASVVDIQSYNDPYWKFWWKCHEISLKIPVPIRIEILGKYQFPFVWFEKYQSIIMEIVCWKPILSCNNFWLLRFAASKLILSLVKFYNFHIQLFQLLTKLWLVSKNEYQTTDVTIIWYLLVFIAPFKCQQSFRLVREV